MKRYTKKIKDDFCAYLPKDPDFLDYIGADRKDLESTYDVDLSLLVDKLGKLEDLEEQLGCPLEVVFEALKQGYIYVYDNHYNFDNYTKTKSKITFNNNIFYIGFARLTRRLKDYQKTWWLKGEKSNE